MTEKERDERRQVEEGLKEDLELDESEAGEVRGGDDATTQIPHLPGRLKWEATTLKKG